MADVAELLVRIDATTESLRRELKRGDQAVADSAQKVEAATARANRAFQQGSVALASNSRNMGTAIQQAGFQVGDFFVQVASGQGILRPLIQQGTQFVSAFGPWGAVLGAAGAIAGALAATLLNLGDSTKTAAEAQKTLQDALDKTAEFLETATEKAARLRNEQKLAAIDSATTASAQQAAIVASKQQEIAVLESLQRVQRQTGGAGQIGGKKLDQLRRDLEFARGQMEFFQGEADRVLGAPASGAERDDANKRQAKDDKKAFDDLIDSLVKTGEARDKARQSIDDQIEGLRTEAAAVKDSERARFIANEALKAERTLRQSQLDSHEIEDRIALVKQEAAANYDASEAAKARDKATKEAQRLDKKRADELGHLFESSFDRVGAAITEMSLEGQDAFKDLANVGKAIASEIAQDFIKLAAINPLKNALFGGNSPTLGDAGGLFGKIGNFFTGAGEGGTFGGVGNGPAFRAGGGSVSASSPYIVGEKGPELFIPHTAGAVVANDRLGGGGGPVFNIDARGASVDAVVRLEKMVRSLNGSIEGRAVAAVADYSRRGR